MKAALLNIKRVMTGMAGVTAGLVALPMALAVIIGIALTKDTSPWKGFQKPDDVMISRELLAKKFKGQAYFQFGAETEPMPRFYISSADAMNQIGRIVKERGLLPDARGKLEELIRTLTEPPDSRIAGIDRVNVLQLNLALDEMKRP